MKRIILFSLFLAFICGCATAPRHGRLVTYHIHGTSYVPLVALCASQGIEWDYDTLTRTVVLTKSGHRIRLHVGGSTIVKDSRAYCLAQPVDLLHGQIMVPLKFKEDFTDPLLNEAAVELPPEKINSQIKKIVVDAGHGGKDPGAIGRSGAREKDINLDIAKSLAELLRKDGFEVIMTRSSDFFVPLPSRVAIANRSGADLFISVHTNANRSRSLNGFEVYYVSPTVSDVQRAMDAARHSRIAFSHECLENVSYDTRVAVWDMIYTHGRSESISLARSICATMKGSTGAENLGVKSARFHVLRDAQMPAILIEVGFISNKNEESILRTHEYREKIARSIREGVDNYAREFPIVEAKNLTETIKDAQ